MSDEWEDYTGVERMKQLLGIGDRSSLHFSANLRGPIIPGSIAVRVLPEDAVSQLAAIEDPTRYEAICTDGDETGVLTGDAQDGSVVNYRTGQIIVSWRVAPGVGEPVWITWKRRLHRLHDAKVQVRLPPSDLHTWVSLSDLKAALENL